ncbi:BON domain-containing protein [Bremerella sp. T1]|uniref:BON domain-containing protein n=1 Tax=Bremerella sp. TYQ1 TaxID=3119568 RepID=UPI001CCFC7EB|nr:BON domain-containing protein [Bremerella volcania]UBM37489.1 BON domain-containing protein [Bremerella volcania]
MSRLIRLAIIAAFMAVPAIAMGGDTEIAQSIVKQLQAKKSEGSLKGFNIGLRVEEGVVWLEGHVSNPQQHDLAVDVARRVSGVQRVVDAIRIEGNAVVMPEAAEAPRDLAAADLTKPAPQPEVKPAAQPRMEQVAQQLPEVPQMIEEPMLEPQGDFSFSPVQPVSAEKPSADESVMANQPTPAAPIRQLKPVPAGQPRPMPAQAPAYQVAANNNAAAANAHARMAQQPMAAVAPPAYYPAQYGYGYYRPARYDHPHMPGYAWPAYAAHPNYAAVTYPKQYSPQAWPYIGPFYPYPQVPLGWRKVEMEWKDGWWTLDFKARRHNSF